jgi:hypothetical protein
LRPAACTATRRSAGAVVAAAKGVVGAHIVGWLMIVERFNSSYVM